MSTGGFFRRSREDESAPATAQPTEEQTITDSGDETVMAPADEAAPTAAMGDCAICHQPVTSDQEYVQASYGLVHRDVCGQQTHPT